MRTYLVQTESLPARGGGRRGMSLQGVPTGPNAESQDIKQVEFFAVADMVDPATGRVEGTALSVNLQHRDNTIEHIPGVISWRFDSASHYDELSFSGPSGLAGGTVAGSQRTEDSTRYQDITIVLP